MFTSTYRFICSLLFKPYIPLDVKSGQLEKMLIGDIISKDIKFFKYPSFHAIYKATHWMSYCGRVHMFIDYPYGDRGSYTFLHIDDNDFSYGELDLSRVKHTILYNKDPGTTKPTLSLYNL